MKTERLLIKIESLYEKNRVLERYRSSFAECKLLYCFELTLLPFGESESILLAVCKKACDIVILDGLEVFEEKCLPAQSSLLAAVLKLIDSIVERNESIIGLVNSESTVNIHPSITQPYRLGSMEVIPPLTATDYDHFLTECYQVVEQATTIPLSKQVNLPATRETSYSADLAISTVRNGIWEGTLFKKSALNNTSNIHEKNHPLQPKQSFDFGYEPIKDLLLEWFQPPSSYSFCPSGIMIAGPSGSGKSYLIDWLVSRVSSVYYILQIPCADLVHKQVGHSEQVIVDYFQKAQQNAPSIIIFDNLDILFHQEVKSSNLMKRLQSSLLHHMDGYQTQGSHNHQNHQNAVHVIATLTHPNALDIAFARPGRLEEQIILSYPTNAQKEQFILHWIMYKFELSMDAVPSTLIREQIQNIARQGSQLPSSRSYGDMISWLQEQLLATISSFRSSEGVRDENMSLVDVLQHFLKQCEQTVSISSTSLFHFTPVTKSGGNDTLNWRSHKSSR